MFKPIKSGRMWMTARSSAVSYTHLEKAQYRRRKDARHTQRHADMEKSAQRPRTVDGRGLQQRDGHGLEPLCHDKYRKCTEYTLSLIHI